MTDIVFISIVAFLTAALIAFGIIGIIRAKKGDDQDDEDRKDE